MKKTVREDLFELLKGRPLPRAAQEEQVARAVTLCRLEELLDRHPYDLSGGEQQRAALAKILLLEPDVDVYKRQVEVLNPTHHIATLGPDATLSMELTLSHGRGYVSADKNKSAQTVIGVIPVDSIYTQMCIRDR